jgi:hypothetical protein
MKKPIRRPGYFDWRDCTEYAIEVGGFKRKVVEDLWSTICNIDPPSNGSVFWLPDPEDNDNFTKEEAELINWLWEEFDEQFFVSW